MLKQRRLSSVFTHMPPGIDTKSNTFSVSRPPLPPVFNLPAPGMPTSAPGARALLLLATLFTGALVSGCSSKPLLPFTTDTTPLMLVPALTDDRQDRRGRYREIFCAVLEAGKETLPDYRSCETALITVGREPSAQGRPVELGPAKRRLRVLFVPGLGWDCFSNWLGGTDTMASHLRRSGYEFSTVNIDGLSSSRHNARIIRHAIDSLSEEETASGLVLIGYSKGIVDVLTTLSSYPDIHSRVTAVVSLAGAVGGSPLTNDTSETMLGVMALFPGAECTRTGGSALEDLNPQTRKAWLAEHPLPRSVSYYSLITYPQPDRISNVLENSYRKLSKIDGRNDSQLIFYDQVIPGSALVAYLNADHLAVALPVARNHGVVGKLFVEQNAFPREAMLEALLRLIEEDLRAGKRLMEDRLAPAQVEPSARQEAAQTEGTGPE